MTLTSRDCVKQTLRLASNGPAGRKLPLRILFVQSDAAGVELCVHALSRAHFKVSADVVLTPD